jgi:hypothetical protein
MRRTILVAIILFSLVPILEAQRPTSAGGQQAGRGAQSGVRGAQAGSRDITRDRDTTRDQDRTRDRDRIQPSHLNARKGVPIRKTSAGTKDGAR